MNTLYIPSIVSRVYANCYWTGLNWLNTSLDCNVQMNYPEWLVGLSTPHLKENWLAVFPSSFLPPSLSPTTLPSTPSLSSPHRELGKK